MLLASIEELHIREVESASQYNNGTDRNKEEELEELAGCEAGAEQISDPRMDKKCYNRISVVMIRLQILDNIQFCFVL